MDRMDWIDWISAFYIVVLIFVRWYLCCCCLFEHMFSDLWCWCCWCCFSLTWLWQWPSRQTHIYHVWTDTYGVGMRSLRGSFASDQYVVLCWWSSNCGWPPRTSQKLLGFHGDLTNHFMESLPVISFDRQPRGTSPALDQQLWRFSMENHRIQPWWKWHDLPSGKLTVCYGKSPFLIGKSTISMTMFNSYVKLPFSIAFCMFTRG